MLNGSHEQNITALGVNVVGTAQLSATEGIPPVDTSLPVGHAGTLTTATIAMVTGHGLTDGTFDVHGVGWCRYGCTIDFTGDSAAVTGGAGDALANGAVVVTAAVTLDVAFDGDNLALIGVGASRQTSVRFLKANSDVIADLLIVANGAWGWDEDSAIANPLTGDAVASVEVSNGSATYESALKITGLQY
jgi:hypothetical protein